MLKLPIIYAKVEVIPYGIDNCVPFIKNGKADIAEEKMESYYLYKIVWIKSKKPPFKLCYTNKG